MPTPLPRDPILDAHANWERAGWTEEAAPMAAITALVRAEKILMQRIEAVMRAHELTFARFELLALLHFSRTGALPMNRASALLQVHPTSVTNAADRLERAGLITREPHPTDGRTTLLRITGEGNELMLRAAADLNAQVFADSGLTGEDVQDLTRILARFRRVSGDFV